MKKKDPIVIKIIFCLAFIVMIWCISTWIVNRDNGGHRLTNGGIHPCTPPTLSSPSLSPGNGTRTTTFTYSVTYSDENNIAPSYVRVHIDGSSYSMSKENASDVTYSDGCIYTYSRALTPGSHEYYFSANNSMAAVSTATFLGPDVINNAPTLSGYSLSPGSGTPSTTFTYAITYTDIDDDAPTYMYVYIDGSGHSMSKQNASDTTYSDGCAYTYSTTLLPGSHVYSFSASDGYGFPSTSVQPGPTVVEDAPVLTAGSMTPTFGNTSTIFTYTVTYTDAENQAPSYVRVVIDGIAFNMSKQNASDTTYTDGCIYVYNCTLVPGTHNYYFLASDGYSPVTSSTSPGPTVTNCPPVLTSGQVMPMNGSCTEPFTFTVNYTDADNHQPSYVRVTAEGISLDMSKQNASDENYVDGCIFILTLLLPPGSFSFRYNASDGYSTVATSTISGLTVLNAAPLLGSGGVTPVNGTQSTIFTFHVTYTDPDNQPPSNVDVYINGTSHSMSKQNASDSNYTDGCFYFYTTTLVSGQHMFYFNASDGYALVTTNTSTLAVSFISAPRLVNPGVSPTAGTNTTVFNFSVTYFDDENTFPTSINVTINSTTFTLVPLSPGDTNVVDGKVYIYSTTLPWGRYQFRMNCSSGLVQNSTAWILGPEVNPFTATTTNVTVFQDDFESGTSKWPTMSGLWHITSTSSPWTNPCHSPTHSAWYGQEATGNYATGSRTYGVMVSTSFSLAGYTSTRLEFYQWFQGEGGSWDYCYVDVSTDGGSSWGPLYKNNANIANWQRCSLDMSAYCGFPSVKIRFYFDSMDSINNNYRGWLVDDVKITAITGGIINTLTLPSNGSIASAGDVIFTWTNPPSSFPLTFRWQLSTNFTFTPILDLVPSIPSASPSTSFVRNIDRATGVYYWRVRPEAYGFWGNWSAPGYFNLRQSPALSNGSVDPPSGNTLTSFTFRVTYAHPDNYAPSYVRVNIDGTFWTMSKVNSSDVTYTDGCVYSYSCTSLVPGSHNYYYTASDSCTEVTTSTTSGPTVTNSAPTLTSGSVSPVSGVRGTTYMYLINYTDADNNAPSYVRVYIDGSPWTMSKVNSGDVTYTDGCAYYLSCTALSLGSHNYYFATSDSYTEVTTSTLSGPTVTNIAPTLTSASLSPTSGGITTTFVYIITYTDADNDAPSYVRVYIDGSFYTMSKQNSGDNTYTDGCVYIYSRTLSSGTHNYYFSTNDGFATTTTSTYGGPTVTNNAPVLSSGSVTPSSGTTNTAFTYAVTYTDADNNAPSYVRVYIDGSFYTMSKQYSGDNTYTDGCVYISTQYLPLGTHNYYFSTNDGAISANTPTSSGPSVSDMSLTQLSISPGSGDTSTDFRFQVTYTHINNYEPYSVTIYIDGQAQTMTKVNSWDTYYMDGCDYEYTTKLGAGVHTYFVVCSRSGESAQTSSNSIQVSSVPLSQPATILALMLILIGAVATISTASIAYKVKVRKSLTSPVSSSLSSSIGASPRTAFSPTGTGRAPYPDAGNALIPVTSHLLPPSAFVIDPVTPSQPSPGDVAPRASATIASSSTAQGQAPASPPSPEPILPGSPKWAHLSRFDISMYYEQPDDSELREKTGESGDPGGTTGPNAVSDASEDQAEDFELASDAAPDQAVETEPASDGIVEPAIDTGPVPGASAPPAPPAALVVRLARDVESPPAASVICGAIHVAICPSCRKNVQVDGVEGSLSYLCRACMKPMNYEITCAACSTRTEISQEEFQEALATGMHCPVCFEFVKL